MIGVAPRRYCGPGQVITMSIMATLVDTIDKSINLPWLLVPGRILDVSERSVRRLIFVAPVHSRCFVTTPVVRLVRPRPCLMTRSQSGETVKRTTRPDGQPIAIIEAAPTEHRA